MACGGMWTQESGIHLRPADFHSLPKAKISVGRLFVANQKRDVEDNYMAQSGET